MKCWHLVAALGLAACGLNSAPVPQAGRAFDAGASDSATADDMGGQSVIAGSPASWPTRKRLPRLVPDKKDGGTSDTKGAGGSGPSSPGNQGGTTSPSNQGNNPSSSSPGQSSPGQGGKTSPGAKGGQVDAGTPSGGTKPSNGSHKMDSGTSGHDAGKAQQHDSGDTDDHNKNHGSKDAGHDDDDDDDHHSGHSTDKDAGSGSHDPTQSSPGNPVADTIGTIVDLVLAIVDLSLTGSPPAIQQLVSTILVFSLAPVDLAADSLSEVLDALDNTNICHDHPQKCDPLCQDLTKECKVCDHDEDCIEHIEETCHVHLSASCY